MTLKKQRFSTKQLLIFISLFALIGGAILIKSFAASNPNLPGDINNDNTVNITDLSILLTNYGTTNATADLNADNTVNVIDLSILLSHFGQSYTGGGGAGATGDYYVSPNGSDSNPGTSSAPFKTIQKAANVATSGKIVIVMNGTYSSPGCNTYIFCADNSNVIFRAQNRWKAVLDGQNSLTDGIWINGTGVTIDGFEIKNFANNGSSSGITMYDGGAGSKILNNNIHDIGRICTGTSNGEVGIEINVSNVTVDSNYIHDIGRLANGEQGCSNANSNWQNHDHGMYVDASGKTNTGMVITNNFFKNMKRGWAIQVYPGTWNNIQINNNKFVGGNPYRSYSFVIFNINISSSTVSGNTFYDTNGGAPLYNDGASYSSFTISGNTITASSLFGGSNPSGITTSNNTFNAQISEPVPPSY